MKTSNQEIEFGAKVKDPEKVIEFLKQKAKLSRTIEINRDIYKNDGKYFIKISREKTGTHQEFVFSFKEDLLNQGIKDGLKVATEVDITVSEEQMSALVEIIKLLGYKRTSSFKKHRTEFLTGNLIITLDMYGNNAYLEIEGPTKKEVRSFTKIVPPHLFAENDPIL